MQQTVSLKPLGSLSSRHLAEHLREEAATREADIARFICVAASCFVVATLLVGPAIGWPRALAVAAMTATYGCYYGGLVRVLQRGWFHPAICWLNVWLEISVGAFKFLLDLHFENAEQALTNPTTFLLWGAFILLASLRSNRRLALFAGALAATETLLLYGLLALPRMQAPVPLMLSPPLISLRALYLFLIGCVAALVASRLTRKAEDALRAMYSREQLGKYCIHERLGMGGMAEVFHATYRTEGGFEKPVAIKRILPSYAEDPHFVALFRREAELGSLLHHPNIVQVLDVGRHGDTCFLAMELIEGLSLRELLKVRGPLPLAAVTYLGAELAAALDYVHHRTASDGEPLDLVHRDVNPPNILLSRIGEVKLGDFGIARAAHHASLTVTGRVVGKPGYMAPEQARAEPFDSRSDLFALGLTLYEALTGRRIVQDEERQGSVWGFTPTSFPPPSAFRPELPPALDAIVLELLQWEPHERTQTARQVREQLCALSGEANPYLRGQALLASTVQEALIRRQATGSPEPQETEASQPCTARLRPLNTAPTTRSLITVPTTRTLPHRPSGSIQTVNERVRP
ncbi:serine/threonine-protein kinase [Vitiosangium sp. GDMCC 1.1324]|uniref:serine/threonine-protein kinase n=1 Tax=Vitiosangium sp. (strain GDMCC 1.1324) TaxID=2138576 RepID=UPI000D393E68|nr:serine/threonine-protein kinase [Vitiosangium sp. GDMCC 1.1324]PTL80781.1 serine/threonine protein kinase [Vitiosangium sp. GDMCC 1.1324]